MSSYEVRYEHDETGWWVASVPSVKGCHTQGRTIEEARRRIREALGLFVDDADEAELVDRVHLPLEARRAVQRLRRVRSKLEQIQADSMAATAEAARVLSEQLGLIVRDVGQLLGLSFQRIQQLKGAKRASRASAR